MREHARRQVIEGERVHGVEETRRAAPRESAAAADERMDDDDEERLSEPVGPARPGPPDGADMTLEERAAHHGTQRSQRQLTDRPRSRKRKLVQKAPVRPYKYDPRAGAHTTKPKLAHLAGRAFLFPPRVTRAHPRSPRLRLVVEIKDEPRSASPSHRCVVYDREPS